MTPTVNTLLKQACPMGASGIVAMTGCRIVVDDHSATLVFGRRVGAMKLTHLKVAYNNGSDLYDLTAYQLNHTTCACPVVISLDGVSGDALRHTMENWLGLYLSL